jgi:hypothetical protein
LSSLFGIGRYDGQGRIGVEYLVNKEIVSQSYCKVMVGITREYQPLPYGTKDEARAIG